LTSDEPADSVPDGETAPSGKGGRRRRLAFRMSVQSKLLLMLLTCSIMSVAVVGIIGYQTGRNGLRSVASERLTELRQAQKRAIETLFRDLTDSLVIYSHGSAAIDALRAFTAGFDQLGNATISPAQQQAIVRYYTDKVVEPIARTTGVQIDVNALLPTSNAQKYLQAFYTASSSPDGEEIKVDDAGDGSPWSAANARFNNYFREIVTRDEYRDAMLLDTRGNIVYTAAKGPDLGSNILTGPYRESNLRGAYEKALGANAVDFVEITDFYPYQPQLDAPTAWLVSPIGVNGKIEGALALPLPIAKVNRIMTADKQWAANGMGKGTETYLAGPDNLMRSDSRLFLQDPKAYRRDAIAAGTPPDVVDKAIRLGGTTLVQPVADAGLRAAQRGQTGVIGDTDYLGNRVLEAYAPLNMPDSDLHWSILATRDRDEAFAQISSFSKTLVLGVVVMIFVICVASMLLAQLILRPIRRLEAGTQKISSGDYDVNIPVTSRDEIGTLTAAFNEMSRNLEIKEELLNEQRKEIDRMLLSLMPEPVVQRYREGEHTIAQEHQDVTVIFADIVGLDQISDDASGDELVEIVDDLFREFDSAAESLGVERIRTLHNWYLASCGVTTPRLDNIHRAMDFAIEMRRIIDRFNSQSGQNLRLRAGLNTGDVISGLVGQSGLVYDMWGSAVSLAHQMYPGSTQPGIYVTAPVYEAMREMWKFTPAATVTVAGVEQQIWRLADRQ
jgi:class 3 adenylate cyclase